MIISFAETIDAVREGRKTQTRRLWSEEYFVRVRDAWLKERYLRMDGWTASPHRGGKKFCEIVVFARPMTIPLDKIDQEDVDEECWPEPMACRPGGEKLPPTPDRFIDEFINLAARNGKKITPHSEVVVLHFRTDKVVA